MKTTIHIKGITEEEGKDSGKIYWKVQTNQGSMTAFDKPVVDELMKNVGKNVSIEMAENTTDDGRTFKNIRKFYEIVSESASIPEEKVDTSKPKTDNFAEGRKEKNQSIYTSYAKDIFLGFNEFVATNPEYRKENTIDQLMDKAIKLVKQAREAFE